MKRALSFFSPRHSFTLFIFRLTGPSVLSRRASSDVRLGMGYVPDGVSPEQWKKMQEKEKQKKVSIVFGFHHCSIHASVDW